MTSSQSAVISAAVTLLETTPEEEQQVRLLASSSINDSSLPRSGAAANDEQQSLNGESDANMPKLSWPKIIALNMTSFGCNACFLLMSVQLLPAQIERLVGYTKKASSLGVIVAIGSVITFIICPLIGMASDQMRCKLGKRRPIMIVATLLLLASWMGMGLVVPNLPDSNTDALSSSKQNRLERESEGQRDNSRNFSNSSTSNEQCRLEVQRCWAFLPRPANHSQSAADADWWRRLYDEFSFSSSASACSEVEFQRQLEAQKQRDFDSNSTEHNRESGTQNTAQLVGFVALYLVTIASYNGVLMPFNGLIADVCPASQRGINSGVMGGMNLLGNLAGAALALLLESLGLVTVYLLAMLLFLACTCVTIICIRENPSNVNSSNATVNARRPFKIVKLFTAFWTPLENVSFRWVFITRFLMQMAITNLIGFLHYWLKDMIALPHKFDVYSALSFVLLGLLISAAISSVLFGFLADRFQRKKSFITAASLLMSLLSLALAAVPAGTINAHSLFFLPASDAYTATLVIGIAFGIGFGAYQSVDFALLMDVLPDKRDRSRDIAVWNQAMVLPQTFAIPLGGLIIDQLQRRNCRLGLGYLVVYLINAVYFLLSGVFVVRIPASN